MRIINEGDLFSQEKVKCVLQQKPSKDKPKDEAARGRKHARIRKMLLLQPRLGAVLAGEDNSRGSLCEEKANFTRRKMRRKKLFHLPR